MGYKTKGFDDILKAFSEMDKKLQNEVGRKAIDEASEIMLRGLKEEAPKDTGESAAFLDKDTIKLGGSHQAHMGINKRNWDKTHPLWYQYWGFSHLKRRRAKVRRESNANQRHTQHAPNNWLDRGFEKTENQAFLKIINEIEGVIK